MNRRDEPIVKNEKRGELRHPEASDLLSPGQLVDRYVIEELIGQGGMATVYRAKHNILGSRHALKLLHEKSATLQESILREGRVQALLDPMYVVPVTDVVTVHQKPALIMPYVEGCSLAELLCEVKPTPGEAAAMGIAICRGVISAHKHGVIHRDLKPSNILLQVKHGHVRIRVADFGLASAGSKEQLALDVLDKRVYWLNADGNLMRAHLAPGGVLGPSSKLAYLGRSVRGFNSSFLPASLALEAILEIARCSSRCSPTICTWSCLARRYCSPFVPKYVQFEPQSMIFSGFFAPRRCLGCFRPRVR